MYRTEGTPGRSLGTFAQILSLSQTEHYTFQINLYRSIEKEYLFSLKQYLVCVFDPHT